MGQAETKIESGNISGTRSGPPGWAETVSNLTSLELILYMYTRDSRIIFYAHVIVFTSCTINFRVCLYFGVKQSIKKPF